MAADTRTAEDQEVDDGLEPPTLRPRLLAWIGVGAIVFILVSIAILLGFYELLLKNAAPQPLHSLPEPRLETSIDPRSMPASPEPGPVAPAAAKTSTAAPDIVRAMRDIAARGEHAYDPLPAPAGNTIQ